MTTTPELTPVTVTEVDGVPTVWAPVAGPLRAGLMLRVGVSDETLLTHGITHLLEHLALFGVGRPGDHSNGCVDATHTMFHVVGDDESVTDFLAAVTRQLADPPGLAPTLQPRQNSHEGERTGRSPGARPVPSVRRQGARPWDARTRDRTRTSPAGRGADRRRLRIGHDHAGVFR